MYANKSVDSSVQEKQRSIILKCKGANTCYFGDPSKSPTYHRKIEQPPISLSDPEKVTEAVIFYT